MFSRNTFASIFFWILVIIAIIIPDATSYSKYGRTCKDIGCRSDETCMMAEDPCHGYSDQCGRYPTCKRISDASCTTTVCGQNEYCKSENGIPKCVRQSIGSENDEARVPARQSSYPTETETRPRGSSDTSNSDGQSHPTKSSGYPGLGYPSSNGYPSQSSSYPSSGSSGHPSSGSSGYPSSGSSGYPSSGSSGYPSSGSSGYPSSGSSSYPSSGSSGYPSSANAGYPSYPRTSAYPTGNPSYHGNYPNQNSRYPSSNYPSGNQPYLPYSNQGNSHGYPQNYPQGYYQNQNYMTTTKKPGFREQLTNIARTVAEKVLTQAIVDRVTGKQS